MSLIEVAQASSIPEGTMREVTVSGSRILVARVGDRFYAAQNSCPHMGGRLVQGRLEGTIITCPLHGSQFDLSDGRVVRWLKGSGAGSAIGRALRSPKGLKVYKVEVRDDKLMVEI